MQIMRQRNGRQLSMQTLRVGLVIAALCVAWILSSAATVVRYLPHHAGAVLTLGSIAVTAIFTGVLWLTKRGWDLPKWSVFLPVAVLILSYVAIYPRTQHLGPGRGSDREDALRVELAAVRSGVYPYSVRTYLGDLPTPLPGAMLLAAPFYLLGRISLQNVVWVLLFAAAIRRIFQRSATAVAVLLVFLLLAFEGLNDFVAGGDYVVNALYVAVAIFFVDRELSSCAMSLRCFAAFLLLGVCISSRVCYLPVLFPILALTRQKVGWRAASVLAMTTLAVSAAVTLPVFLPHPVEKIVAYSSQIPGKLRDLPAWLPPSAIEAFCLLTAASAFAFRMDLRRVYLVVAASTTALIAPPMLALVFSQTRRGLPLNHQMVYFTAPSLFFALWAAGWLERETMRSVGVACG